MDRFICHALLFFNAGTLCLYGFRLQFGHFFKLSHPVFSLLFRKEKLPRYSYYFYHSLSFTRGYASCIYIYSHNPHYYVLERKRTKGFLLPANYFIGLILHYFIFCTYSGSTTTRRPLFIVFLFRFRCNSFRGIKIYFYPSHKNILSLVSKST